MTLGEKIKGPRKQCGLSQEQLAEKLAVSRSAVAKWETDKGIPDIANLIAISDEFGLSLDELIKDIIREVTDGAILVEKNGKLEAINIDFVIRIREFPRNKNGKKKSVVLD